LIDLLGDDSTVVLTSVRKEFERLGRTAAPALRNALRAADATTRSRARQLLLEADRRRVVRRLVRYASRTEHELETALFLLDRYADPRDDMRAYRRALDAFADELRRRLQGVAPGRARVLVMIDYLHDTIGFDGAANDYHHPGNIHLCRAIERRAGMPLTLCAIYSFVARRAGLRAEFLALPGHVLLQVTDGGERIIVDPFNQGRILSETDCLSYLAQHGFPYRSEWFEPATATAIFRRHVLNLMNSCMTRDRQSESRALELVHRVLSRHEAPLPAPVV